MTAFLPTRRSVLAGLSAGVAVPATMPGPGAATLAGGTASSFDRLAAAARQRAGTACSPQEAVSWTAVEITHDLYRGMFYRPERARRADTGRYHLSAHPMGGLFRRPVQLRETWLYQWRREA